MIGPTGFAGAIWPAGEIAAAKAARRAGTVYTISHASTVSIERIAKEAGGALWFQNFIFRDRSITERFATRANDAGCEAMVVTVDTQVPGQRERDLRNGFTLPPRFGIRNVLDFAAHPAWLLRQARRMDVAAANYKEQGLANILKAGQRIRTMIDPAASWDEIRWIRDLWRGALVIKGILSDEEAKTAAEIGVDGIVVSNHGGRQLDGVVPTIAALPGIARAVDGRCAVLIDGGLRRGVDVMRAIALGAQGVLIGRPHLWGLAVGGEAGVARILDIYRNEIDRAMALTGCDALAALSASDFIFTGSREAPAGMTTARQ